MDIEIEGYKENTVNLMTSQPSLHFTETSELKTLSINTDPLLAIQRLLLALDTKLENQNSEINTKLNTVLELHTQLDIKLNSQHTELSTADPYIRQTYIKIITL